MIGANDPGDIDGDTEALPTDTNDPFCHRLYFQNVDIRKTFTTSGTGTFSSVVVPLAPYEIGGDPLGNNTLNGQLCISSEPFQYRGPVPPEEGAHMATSQAQSVPIKVTLLGGGGWSAPPECSDHYYVPASFRFRASFDYRQNLARAPALPNLAAAMDQGASGWNTMRTSGCAVPGQSWTAYRNLGTTTAVAGAKDGVNTVGWDDFANPSTAVELKCRASMQETGIRGNALHCPSTSTSSDREEEFDVIFNNNNGSQHPWSTDLNAPANYSIVQATATHEFGHVSGLAHTEPAASCTSSDPHAHLTMYTCAIYDGRANSWPHTLGAGDMDGLLAVRP